MGLFSKIVEWFKGPVDDEEAIEIAARKAAEKAAAMVAREQAQTSESAPEESPVEKFVEQPIEKPEEKKPAAKKTAEKPEAKKTSVKVASKKETPKKEVKPAAEKKVVEKKAAEKKTAAKPEVRATDKFPGVTTYRELSILEKNSCAGADKASVTVATLTKELKETVLQIARLRNPVDADEATRDKLSKERAVLRKQRDEKERTLTLARNAGVGLEKTADNCQFLIKELTGQVVNHRKAPRFNEVSVDISPEEVEQMRGILK